ncbi:MAG: chromosome segregation protein SMC [Erysipelotrichaceae bacterium]|nr:chromosome segregation protein SMC [Erysipelotrichaceae bacterium]
MFLKQIRLQGFKSFANKTVINFDSDYTGIVGPNGCGKSNIIDAIKWVLGEQSPKNMRGSTMTDVVFSGAEGKRAVSMAEVTLVFDNSRKYLNSEYEELEITRRLSRDGSVSEYLINNSPCRLKDIVDLTLDTGLSRDSLSMISQGTIQSFADARPIDRRSLFEEAAGVAKYKKRKLESLSKLQKTQENIDRLNDIVAELYRQVAPLERQAHKAEEYAEKKQRLTEIEVAVIVSNIQNINTDLQTIEKQLFDLEYQETTTKASIQILDNDSNTLKEEVNRIDSDVQLLQDKLLKILDEVQILEKRKVEVDEKRRYLKETGTSEDRIKETKQMLDNAYEEYQDRLNRNDALNTELELLSNQLNDINFTINENQQSNLKLVSRFNQLNSRQSVLENMINSPFANQQGVNTVIKNKTVLPGIYDALSNLIKVDDGYQQAVSQALAASLYHIVTKDVESAKGAIRFLKNNKSGNATFLPLEVLKPRYVNNDHLFVCENTPGFLGLASDFVDCKEMFDVVILSLLGNVLVTEDLDSASELASRLNYGYKVVTLDGDVIYRGGSLSGGYNKQADSPLTYKMQLDEVRKQIRDVQNEMDEYSDKLGKLTREREEKDSQRVSVKVQLASLKELVDIKRDKYEKLKEEYDRIRPDSEDGSESFADELISSLNRAYASKDELTSQIRQKRERRLNANNEYQRKYNQLRQVRNDLIEIINKTNGIKIEEASMIANRDNQLERLARDYSLTYEYAASQNYDVQLDEAKDEVARLRQEISELGAINPEAPEQFREVNERYTFMTSQLDDLTAARDKLLQAISEMDEVMTAQFSDAFGKINESLAEVFSILFGGGKARLVLEDPNDILNTGIDIDVQPPGKNIQNIRLFSGGEKSLIAICVLFAILKARPVPLCVLDEVEASLDSGNVDRFARYIHKFSNDTQFVVITHRPGTMTECDVLYGITMQQKGVSSVLKVKLKEALQYAGEDENEQ